MPPPWLPQDTQKYVANVWGECVTLTSVRTNSDSVAVELTDAAVYRLGLKEAAPSNGVYQSEDIRVTVATDAIEFEPKPRDTVLWKDRPYQVLDASGSDWTKHWVLTCRRLVLASDLSQTGTLSRPSNAQDAAGRPTLASYTTVAENVACRVQPEGGTAGDVLGRRTMPLRFTAYLATPADARAKDKFECDGVTYTVLEAKNPERITDLMSLTLEKV